MTSQCCFLGVAGLYDYGPSGCAIEANVLNLWRSHFVLEEQMLEIKSTQLTPHVVLKYVFHICTMLGTRISGSGTKKTGANVLWIRG